jgi:Tol biopolymer transport system component
MSHSVDARHFGTRHTRRRDLAMRTGSLHRKEHLMRRQTMNRVEALLRILTLFALVAGGVLAGMKPAHAAFPGSAGSIAFQTDQGGNFADIYKMNADGTFPTPLASYPSWGSVGPAWSSDGKRLAYSYGTIGHYGIYVVDATGTYKWPLTVSFSLVDSFPDFYPGKNKIVFESSRSGGGDLYAITFTDYYNTSDLTRLTRNASEETTPAVSPDGKKLAFASNRDGDMDIYVMNAGSPESATNKPVKLTRNSVNDAMPDWSPSGRKIVFQGYRSGSEDVLSMNADGSNPVNLTKNYASDGYPAFSPDGKKIAFASNRSGGDYDIWRMNADGSTPVNLTSNSPGLDLDPSWQPLP